MLTADSVMTLSQYQGQRLSPPNFRLLLPQAITTTHPHFQHHYWNRFVFQSRHGCIHIMESVLLFQEKPYLSMPVPTSCGGPILPPKVDTVPKMTYILLTDVFTQLDTPVPSQENLEQGPWKALYDRIKEQDTNMAEGYTSDIDSLLIFVSLCCASKNVR
jgi:hypothetical protein